MSADAGPFLLDTCMDEAEGHLIYTDDDLMPHFALDRVVKDADGTKAATFDRDGEPWEARLVFSIGGLAPRDDPDYRLESVPEHRIYVRPMNDPPGKRTATFHIAPRWLNMETTDGKPVSTPDVVGVDVDFSGAKLPFDAYPDLLRRAADALGVNPGYFADEHPYSNVYTAESYARVNRSKTDAMFGDNSPMQRIFELARRTGKFRKLHEDDRGHAGSMHFTAFTSETAGALIDGHALGKRPKHYLLKHPPSDPSNPLHHPKVGMLFKSNLNDSGSVPWSGRAGLREELDEALLNLLSWSGLPTRPNGETFIEDGYFAPTDSAQPHIGIIDDPTPEIRREQGTAVMKALGGPGVGNPDLNQSDADTMEVVADGGRDVDELARLIGTSRRTVYNVVRRLNRLLALDGGTVAFASDYLASKAQQGLESASVAFDADGGGSAEQGPWAKFKARYAPEVGADDESDTVDLRFGEVPEDTDMTDVLKDGLRAWLRSGRSERRFRFGRASWIQNGSTQQAGGPLGKMNLGFVPGVDGVSARR